MNTVKRYARAAQLAEIRGMGYPGSMKLFYRYIAQSRVEADRPHWSGAGTPGFSAMPICAHSPAAWPPI